MTKIHDIEQVIDAGAKIFAEKGFDAARLEDIAAELGVLQGSLYYHIGSKAHLLFLVQRRRLLTIVDRLETIVSSNETSRVKIAEAIGEHLQHLDRHYPESSQWFTEPSSSRASNKGREEIRSLNRRYSDAWARIVEQGIAAGQIDTSMDPDIAARALLGMCNWVPRWYRQDGTHSMEAIAGLMISLAWNGLRGRLNELPEVQ